MKATFKATSLVDGSEWSIRVPFKRYEDTWQTLHSKMYPALARYQSMTGPSLQIERGLPDLGLRPRELKAKHYTRRRRLPSNQLTVSLEGM